jgi:hypothetical protein
MIRNGSKVEDEVWGAFCSWAMEHKISLDNEEVWGPWFDCYQSGYYEGLREMADMLKQMRLI